MKDCTECVEQIKGEDFCTLCEPSVDTNEAETTGVVEHDILKFSTYMFQPKKDYTITSERLSMAEKGVFTETQDSIELYKINDVIVTQDFIEKLLNVGSIAIMGTDLAKPYLVLKNIREPLKVKEALHDAIAAVRENQTI